MKYNFAGNIITNRLILKVLKEDQAGDVLDYFVRNRAFLEKWEPEREEQFYTIGYHQQQFKLNLDNIKNGRAYKLWLFNKENEGRVVGSIALNNIVRGCFQSCHLGYRLDKDEINQGYMTEGLKAAIHFAFTELKLHRIEANIMPVNKQSLRVTAKLGFKNEGLARKYLKINGKWEDHIHMVLLNKDLE